MCCNSNFSIGITASIWTVVQTSVHIIWALCGYYFYVCKIKPSYYGLVMVYLTYFYKDECGNITLKSAEFLETQYESQNLSYRHTLNVGLGKTEDDDDLHAIIQRVLDEAVLPEQSRAAYRTHIYFHIFIITDAAWIVAAFLLFAGTCFHIRKCLSLIFYCPWLIVSAIVILLDVVSSVHFGLDILQFYNFTSWLRFIGVQNYQDFTEYNEHTVITLIPVLVLCTLFSRAVVFWIYNIVLFVQVFNTAILAFQDNLDENNRRRQAKTGTVLKRANQNVNLDTSASRIRNWQLFYGAIDTTSSSSNSERDSNSNNTMRRTSTRVKITDTEFQSQNLPQTSENLDSYEKYVMSIKNESEKMKQDSSSYYHQYTDVAESFENPLGKEVGTVHPIRRQRTWTYVKMPDERHQSCSHNYEFKPSYNEILTESNSPGRTFTTKF